GRKRMPDALVLHGVDQARAVFKAKQLTRIEEVGIAVVAPAMQAVGFIAGKDRLLGHEERRQRLPPASGLAVALDILFVGLLEKPPLVPVFPGRIEILDGKEPVPWRARLRARI